MNVECPIVSAYPFYMKFLTIDSDDYMDNDKKDGKNLQSTI